MNWSRQILPRRFTLTQEEIFLLLPMRSPRSLLSLLSVPSLCLTLKRFWQRTPYGLLPWLLLGVSQGVSQPVPDSIPDSASRGNPFASSCPLLFKPLLEEKILPDLPSYVNRSLQRQPGNALHYLLGLSPPDYVPGSLTDFSDRHPELELESLLKTPNLHQVFLTSRERSYSPGGMENFQEFHWLFFHLNDRYQWELVALFSQTENHQLRDGRNEALAQAIDARLQDCWISESDP